MGIDEDSPDLVGPSSAPPRDENLWEELDWISAPRVYLRAGITVRVKENAFDNSKGLAQMHNGRVGEVLEVRDGDVIVRTTDNKMPPLDGAHYSPWSLDMKLDDCLNQTPFDSTN